MAKAAANVPRATTTQMQAYLESHGWKVDALRRTPWVWYRPKQQVRVYYAIRDAYALARGKS